MNRLTNRSSSCYPLGDSGIFIICVDCIVYSTIVKNRTSRFVNATIRDDVVSIDEKRMAML